MVVVAVLCERSPMSMIVSPRMPMSARTRGARAAARRAGPVDDLPVADQDVEVAVEDRRPRLSGWLRAREHEHEEQVTHARTGVRRPCRPFFPTRAHAGVAGSGGSYSLRKSSFDRMNA